jgi:hypothetical protein
VTNKTKIMPPSIMEHLCLPGFANAAAAVAVFELKLRLLADNGEEGTPLQSQAIKADLGKLIDLICDHHKASDEQRALLAKVGTIRNKLFHLELSRVTGRIKPLAEQLQEGNVWMAKLEDGTVHQVSKSSTERGRIYGWLLESRSSGAFDAIATAVQNAIAVINEFRDRAYGDGDGEDVTR